MYDFRVKSHIHDYGVNFIGDLQKALEYHLLEDDFIIVDNAVKELYKNQLAIALDNNNYIGINATEIQKSYQGIIPVIEALIDRGFKKNHRLVAIGGGITQDVTAFIASIMYRGVQWVFFPTTLLAQGDSCIGSKTSINFAGYKNQVGGFYPPNEIFVFPGFVETLTMAEIKSGMGEMLHYFIVASKEDFEMYRELYLKAFSNKDALSRIIARSLEIKKGYIEIDEYDRNVRQVFNYGHSFGHAIESLTNYRIPHGVAVCFGMDMANHLSVRMGFIPETIRKEIRDVIDPLIEDYSIHDIDINEFSRTISKDKKNVGTKLGLILNKGYGNIFKCVMEPDEQFARWLKDYFAHEIKVGRVVI